MTPFRERLFSIMFTGYEAELHGPTSCRGRGEAFLSVAEHRHFRRAVAELGVPPSAVSQAIRALESRMGAPLFIE